MRVLKLGTRKSILAQAQSAWVARTLEKAHPGLKVELVGIVTKGDIIQDKPLTQIEGKEFFTAELDLALMNRETDLTVHSLKDLSTERPAQLTVGAIPERELPHDVVLFHDSVMDRLKAGLPIRIGTSSPRRIALIPEFLKDALPRFSNPVPPTLQMVEIRGNVHTRLSRVHEPEGTEKKLDGVVLAFSGLERLALSDEGEAQLSKLLQHTRMMMVPVSTSPAAPGQGALAVEAHTDDQETLKLLRAIHHMPTEQAVRFERQILQDWGGGCHQRLGATTIQTDKDSRTLVIKGIQHSGNPVFERRLLDLPESKNKSETAQAENTVSVHAHDVFEFEAVENPKLALKENDLVFVGHARALDFQAKPDQLKNSRNWVSGIQSWKKLAELGIWVEGSAEGKGFESLEALRSKRLLRFGTNPFFFLSHADSPAPRAQHGKLITTYRHVFREIPEKIKNAQRIQWNSGSTFVAIWSRLSESEKNQFLKKQHFCGPGRTADQLRAQGITPTIRRLHS